MQAPAQHKYHEVRLTRTPRPQPDPRLPREGSSPCRMHTEFLLFSSSEAFCHPPLYCRSTSLSCPCFSPLSLSVTSLLTPLPDKTKTGAATVSAFGCATARRRKQQTQANPNPNTPQPPASLVDLSNPPTDFTPTDFTPISRTPDNGRFPGISVNRPAPCGCRHVRRRR